MAEVFSFTVSGNLAGQFVQNVMHMTVNPVAPVSAFAMADDIARSMVDTYEFWTAWLSCLPTDYRALSLRVRRVQSTHGATVILLAPSGSSGLGVRAGQISSQSNAPIADLFNETDARRIGKIFMPGISEDDIDGGLYTSSFVGAFDSNYRPFFNAPYTLDLHPIDARFCIFNPAKSPTFLPISDVRLSPLLGTQRRRLKPFA